MLLCTHACSWGPLGACAAARASRSAMSDRRDRKWSKTWLIALALNEASDSSSQTLPSVKYAGRNSSGHQRSRESIFWKIFPPLWGSSGNAGVHLSLALILNKRLLNTVISIFMSAINPQPTLSKTRETRLKSPFWPILILTLCQNEQMEINWIYWGHISPIWVSVMEAIAAHWHFSAQWIRHS